MVNVFVAVAILGVFVILAGRVRVICLAERYSYANQENR